jgi:arylesterase/paraoxonase
LEAKLRVYERDLKTNDLTLLESLEIDTGGDNIDVDNEGNLWIGSHYKVFTFLIAMSDTSLSTLTPSQVVKITFDKATGKATNISNVYMDDGSELLASSVFATWKGKVGLMGSVFDKRILLCEL